MFHVRRFGTWAALHFAKLDLWNYCRLYSVRCQGCGHSLTPGELIMRSAGGRPFHPNCFCCVMCGHQLSKGDQYYIKSGHLFCQMDFEKEFLLYPMSHPDIWSYSSCKCEYTCSLIPLFQNDHEFPEFRFIPIYLGGVMDVPRGHAMAVLCTVHP